ncbi:MAG TPA: peptidylprolyl isomerase [Limnobacter sp.]|nr:peptidylprolyl isomerase [Limnobacter sp.]
MKTSWSAFGFLLVATAIGLLEWLASQQPARNELVITRAQQAFVREQVLKAGEQGAPAGQVNPQANVDKALAAYIDEEILYREGMRLGLEKDDLIVKRRVVQKMRFLLEDMTPLQPPTAAQLQTWLEQNPARYQTGEKIQFEHHFFSRAKRGDEAIEQARAALAELQAGKEIAADPTPLQSDSTGLDRYQVSREIGLNASNALFDSPLGAWGEPVQSALGVHLFKVTSRQPGRLMTVEEAGQQLVADLVAAQRETLDQASMAALRSTYEVRVEP